MVRKLSWVVFVALTAMFLACGHAAKLPAGASSTMVARIGLSARKRSAMQRPPVNLALLVDTSGSMEGRAIADARTASLASTDRVADDETLMGRIAQQSGGRFFYVEDSTRSPRSSPRRSRASTGDLSLGEQHEIVVELASARQSDPQLPGLLSRDREA